MDEESAVLVGYRRGNLWYGRLRQRRVGTPASVEFDWGWALRRKALWRRDRLSPHSPTVPGKA